MVSIIDSQTDFKEQGRKFCTIEKDAGSFSNHFSQPSWSGIFKVQTSLCDGFGC